MDGLQAFFPISNNTTATIPNNKPVILVKVIPSPNHNDPTIVKVVTLNITKIVEATAISSSYNLK